MGRTFRAPGTGPSVPLEAIVGVFLIEVQKSACSSCNYVQKEESLSHHPEKRTLRDQAKRTRTKQHAVGRGHSLSLTLVLPGGVPGECFPPDSLSAPGVCPPRLYGLRTAIHPGNSMLSLNGAATPCVTWDQGTSRENPVPVGPVSFPNHLLRLASFQIPGTCHCSPTFRWP